RVAVRMISGRSSGGRGRIHWRRNPRTRADPCEAPSEDVLTQGREQRPRLQQNNSPPKPPAQRGAVSLSRLMVSLPAMGMPSLLRKILFVDLLKGMSVTFRYQDPKEVYTEQYPLERPQVAERYRGAPRLNVNPDTNETLCIACD